jgi:hypothetical protein
VRVKITLYVQKLHSCVCSSKNACEHHTKEWFLHAEYGFDTYKCRNHFRECHNHTHTCEHHTLLSVVITFVRVKITLRLEITLCVKNSHAAYEDYTVFRIHTLRVAITLCVSKLTLYGNKSHSCVLTSHYSSENILLSLSKFYWKSHSQFTPLFICFAKNSFVKFLPTFV